MLVLRDAIAADGPFIERMLLAAANWSPQRQITLDELRGRPELIHYVSGWPRPGDMGLIAVEENAVPIGAVWLRVFRADDPGYGYVGPAVPELSIGVVDTRRGQGVGRSLLRAQARQAMRSGISALSLSVERANPAAGLYRSEGWRVVESGPDSDTMVLQLPAKLSRRTDRTAR